MKRVSAVIDNLISLAMQVVLGTLLAALVPVVGFNAVMTSEHFASFLVSPTSINGALFRHIFIQFLPSEIFRCSVYYPYQDRCFQKELSVSIMLCSSCLTKPSIIFGG